MIFVDAHHHLWDLNACRYPWLEAKGVKRFFGDPSPIQTDYLLADFLNESKRYRPLKSVHIQVGVAHGYELAESQWLTQRDSKPEALVCFEDLSHPDFPTRLMKQQQIARVKGVRQIVGRHPVEDRQHNSDLLLENTAFNMGLKHLGQTGMSFDLQLIPQQHLRAARLLKNIESLPVAICHAGSPWDQSPEGLAAWRTGLQTLAQRANTFIKISGLGMFNRSWSVDALSNIVYPVIDIFGPTRVMVGSNFPVDKLYRSYTEWWHAIQTLLERYTAPERHAILVDTASRFYRI